MKKFIFKNKDKFYRIKSNLRQLRQENKLLQEKISQLKYEGELLQAINEAITSTFNLSDILNQILQVLSASGGITSASIMLVDENDDTIRIYAQYGLEERDIQDFYIYYARLNEKTLFTQIAEMKHSYYVHEEDILKIPAVMIVPLITLDRLLGFLVIHDTENRLSSLPEEKRILVEKLANQASIAINNAQMFQGIKKQAYIDQNTGLYNHGYFQSKLEEEIEFTIRTGDPLSMLLLDIDHFKKVNDTYGHQYGDIVLKEVAKIMLKNVRGEDTVCRYGGEEFAIILKSCKQEDAVKIGERIKNKIIAISENDNRGIFREKITLSGGAVQFIPPLTKSEIIKRADMALYYAKNNGRNMIHGYSLDKQKEYEKFIKK